MRRNSHCPLSFRVHEQKSLLIYSIYFASSRRNFSSTAIFSSKDFNLPSGEHVDKLCVGVPGRVDIVLQVKTISTKNVKLQG